MMGFFQGSGSALALLGCFVAVQFMSASATNYTVGGSAGWGFNANYTEWAKGKTFKVGDVLFFQYSAGNHSVYVVSKADYGSCNTANASAEYEQGDTSITLNSTGSFYYICGVPGHCSAGMKLAIDVNAASATTPSSSPSPSPSRAPTPSPSPSVKTPTPSPSPSSRPTPTPTPTPSVKTPTPSPSPSSSPTPTPSAKSPTPSVATPSSPTSTPSTSPGSITPAAPGPSGGTSGAPARIQVAGALMTIGSALVGYSVLFW